MVPSSVGPGLSSAFSKGKLPTNTMNGSINLFVLIFNVPVINFSVMLG